MDDWCLDLQLVPTMLTVYGDRDEHQDFPNLSMTDVQSNLFGALRMENEINLK